MKTSAVAARRSSSPNDVLRTPRCVNGLERQTDVGVADAAVIAPKDITPLHRGTREVRLFPEAALPAFSTRVAA